MVSYLDFMQHPNFLMWCSLCMLCSLCWFTWHDFSCSEAISGAKISEYLLEKSRIVNHSAGERNYHIFYELLSGLPQPDLAKYGLTKPEDFFYLSQVSPHMFECTSMLLTRVLGCRYVCTYIRCYPTIYVVTANDSNVTTTAVNMTEMLSLLMTMLSLQGGSSVVDGKSDGQDFQRLTSAMEVLGIRVSWWSHLV